MKLHEVTSRVKAKPTRKRCGRGRGSGLGKTSGRGHKGAASRSGWRRRYGYDGGQTSLVRRLPKRGFTNAMFRERCDVVNLGEIDKYYNAGETVTLDSLVERGIVKATHGRLKLLGTGELKKAVTIVAWTSSASALEKVKAAGGKVDLKGPPRVEHKPVPEAVRNPKKKEAPKESEGPAS